MTDEAQTPGAGAFGDALAEFKRDGCVLLVTGDVPERVSARATRKLLGAPAETRKRVVVLTAGANPPATYLPGTLRPENDGVTVHDLRDSRHRPGDEDGTPRAVDVACTALDRLSSDSAPAEQRFAFASLDPLLAASETESVNRFADLLTTTTRDTTAMAHYHLSRPDDDPAVRSLSPLFDARIELRQQADLVPEQRWHVPDRDTRTEWVTL